MKIVFTIKSRLLILLLLSLFNLNSLYAQVLNNNGAYITISSSAYLVAPSFVNTTGTLLNSGTVESTTLLSNAGELSGDGTYMVGTTFTNTGTFTAGKSTVEFNGSTTQTIPALNYYNLTSSGTGARILASSGTIGVAGTFTAGSNTYTATGSVMDFNSDIDQHIPSLNYNELKITKPGMNYLSGNITSAGRTTVDPSSTFDLKNYNATLGSLSGSGNIVLGSGSITVGSDNSTGYEFSGEISGSGSITKNGTGAITLSGTNLYTGGTILSAGQLNINNASAIGTGTLTINGGSIDNTSSSAIALATNNALNWQNSFTFIGSRNLNLGTGAVTLSASPTITTTANTLTIGGAINNSNASITKAGNGTLSFGSNNVSMNSLTVSAGTVNAPTGSLTLAGDLDNSGTFNQSTGDVNISGDLSIKPSSTYSFIGTSTLTISGTWEQTGTLNAGTGTVVFNGAKGSAITHTKTDITIAFNNLTISKSLNGSSYYPVTLNSNMSVAGILRLTTGNINVPNIKDHLISILSGATITGNENSPVNSMISGKLRIYGVPKTASGNLPQVGDYYSVQFPLEGKANTYQPVTIDYPFLPSPDDYITVTHFTSGAQGTYRKDNKAQRVRGLSNHEYWEVTPGAATKTKIEANDNSGIRLKLSYQTHSAQPYILNTTSSKFYTIGHIATDSENPSDIWNAISDVKPTYGLGSNQYSGTITLPGIKQFCYIGVIDDIDLEKLPVTFNAFTAKLTPENKVALNWSTGSESFNKGFRVERGSTSSADKFSSIGFVATKANGGNSATSLYYNFLDHAPVLGATNTYRIVQEDIDGKISTSEVRLVRLDGHSVVLVYPNPSNGNVVISRTDEGKKMNIQVIDQLGRVVKRADNITEANYRMTISHPGIYTIKLIHPISGEQSIQRIVIHK